MKTLVLAPRLIYLYNITPSLFSINSIKGAIIRTLLRKVYYFLPTRRCDNNTLFVLYNGPLHTSSRAAQTLSKNPHVMDVSKLLQMQTNAAYQSIGRPSPQPAHQSSTAPFFADYARCSRCQRSVSIDASAGPFYGNAVAFGTNSFYCRRCATMVGFKK